MVVEPIDAYNGDDLNDNRNDNGTKTVSTTIHWCDYHSVLRLHLLSLDARGPLQERYLGVPIVKHNVASSQAGVLRIDVGL